MSKYGKYSTESWPTKFKVSKTETGNFSATVTLKELKDKTWEGATEQEAIQKAKTEVDEMFQKGNNTRSS